jgi:hypothetical protein
MTIKLFVIVMGVSIILGLVAGKIAAWYWL